MDAAGPFLLCVGSGVLKSSRASPRYWRAVAVPLGEMVGGAHLFLGSLGSPLCAQRRVWLL